MKNRSPIAVFGFSFITLFIYSWYWQVKTKGEMNKLGEQIPTAFIWLIPIVGSIWWTWKYSEGVEHVTHEKLNAVLAFVVLWLLGPIGNAIVQEYFNKSGAPVLVTHAPSPAGQPVAATAPSQPAPTFTPVATPEPPQVPQPPQLSQPPQPAAPINPDVQPPAATPPSTAVVG